MRALYVLLNSHAQQVKINHYLNPNNFSNILKF